MAKQQTDDELILRRKARRRLIGAVALTLVVVVVLPMVLDSEPRISGKNIDLDIPDPNSAGKFVPRVNVSDMAPPSTGSAETTAPDSSEAAKSNAAPAKEQPASRLSKEIVQKPKENKPASNEGFVAQVGAYSNHEAAKQELKKLKQWGFRAYTESAGDTMRVRVGPYPDRDKAEKVGQMLEKHGYHPVIVSAK